MAAVLLVSLETNPKSGTTEKSRGYKSPMWVITRLTNHLPSTMPL